MKFLIFLLLIPGPVSASGNKYADGRLSDLRDISPAPRNQQDCFKLIGTGSWHERKDWFDDVNTTGKYRNGTYSARAICEDRVPNWSIYR